MYQKKGDKKMKFEPKISGTKVTDFRIHPIFCTQIITLNDCQKLLYRQESMDFILDTFRFSLCKDGEWRAVIDFDTDYKIAILENYPEYEQEMIDYFGENWLKHYIRFNH